MSESPRWERESQADLSAPQSEPQDTVEMELARLVEPDPADADADLDPAPDDVSSEDDGGSEPWLDPACEPAPRLTAARDSLAGARAAARVRLSGARGTLGETADSMAETSRRVGRWLASLDRRPEFDADRAGDPMAELAAGPAVPPSDIAGIDEEAARFPIAAAGGYDRGAVDRRLAELESELVELRAQATAPMSITEEIERLGEQAASILVSAHDTASETARRAQEQAARAVTDAADDAERITTEAQRRLRALDAETNAIWRERERLLADVRSVSATLGSLADAADARFPAEPAPAAELVSASASVEPVAVSAPGATGDH